MLLVAMPRTATPSIGLANQFCVCCKKQATRPIKTSDELWIGPRGSRKSFVQPRIALPS